MARSSLAIIFTFLTCPMFSQTDYFKDYNDTMLVVSCFQSDIIEKEGLTKDFSTNYPDFYHNPVIVYQNFNKNLPTGQGDPLCLWVSKSALDTIESLRWIKIKELYRKNKFVYVTLEVHDKTKGKEQLTASYEYKIKAKKIGQGPKVYFRKLKVKKYLPRQNTNSTAGLISKRKSIRLAKKEVYKTYGYFSVSFLQRPYRKEFEGDLLKMNGTIRKGWKGGVFYVTIDRSDGTIKSISHSK